MAKIKFDVTCDYYQLLEVNENATLNEIEKKYYGKHAALSVMINHDQVNAEMKEYYSQLRDKVVEAYIVLKDEESRKEYDKARKGMKNIKVVVVDESKEAEQKAEEAKETVKKKSTKGIIGLIILCVALGAGTLALALYNRKHDDDTEKVIIEEDVTDDLTTEEVTYAFGDASDDKQVHDRAVAIHECLVNSNVGDITVEELENQIRFINGTYKAESDEEAYELMNSVLETFGEYGTAVSQAANFAGGVVDENGVRVALGLDAFCVDNSEHKEFMDEASMLFINVLTADTEETKVNASKMFLKQQADLQLGLLVDETGTKLNYFSLEDNEGFTYGIMSQVAAPIIKAALGEDYVFTYTDNMGQEVDIEIDTILRYYNPQCGNDYDTENVWNQFLNELINKCIIRKLSKAIILDYDFSNANTIPYNLV